MISLQKLIYNLNQCRDSNIVLTTLNDLQENLYMQKTAIDLRIMELENVVEVFTQLNEANFTMDKELEELNRKLEYKNTGNIATSRNIYTSISIPHEALIIYVENEITPLPELILNLLSAVGKSHDEWYIYGVKNPESFYKSFLLLTQLDFIIKNKTEKKNEIATFKREMALHYEIFYTELEYRKLHLPHYDIIHKLTSMDNYCGYDVIRFLCDYCQVNIILLDIIERKYLDIRYIHNTLVHDVVKKPHTINEFIIIIKYVNETYLPLMNSNGNHIFTQVVLDWISHNYERIIVDNFKEPILKSVESCDNKEDKESYNTELDNELHLSDIENLSLEERESQGNFLDSKTISVFFNNTISSKEQEIHINPIIKTDTISMVIEDMIDISEAPILGKTSTITGFENKNEFDILIDKIPISTSIDSNLSKIKNNKFNKTSIKAKQNIIDTKVLVSEPSHKSIYVSEELKPIKVYNLLDLQMLARIHKIDIQKNGKAGKKVNKTKEEIYKEIQEIKEKEKE